MLVSAQRRGAGRVLLRVFDTGCGISAANLDTVFDEFVQLDNTERDRRKGLGLGLAIVKRGGFLIHRFQVRRPFHAPETDAAISSLLSALQASSSPHQPAPLGAQRRAKAAA